MITIQELEEAIGQTLSGADLAQANYYIKLVTRYIKSYTGRVFDVQTSTELFKADYYGRVALEAPPVHQVDSVKYHHGGEVWDWQFDGLEEVYGLKPRSVVQVTYTHGFESPPEDLKGVCTEAAKRLFLSPEGQDVGPLKRFAVGDISEEYNIPPADLAGLFNDLDKIILDEYRVTETTWRGGFHQPDNNIFPKSNESALFE